MARSRTVDVCPVEELPPGHVKIVWSGPIAIGVYNCGGKLYALEDRCSHDDGPLCEGEWEEDECIAICPRHGARFDITTGAALTLPAYEPVASYPGPDRGRLGPGRRLTYPSSRAPATFRISAERRWSGSGDFQYGQWRCQPVGTCP